MLVVKKLQFSEALNIISSNDIHGLFRISLGSYDLRLDITVHITTISD